MKHLDLRDQEELTTLKYFIQDWGKYVGMLVAAAIIAYLSSLVWNWYQNRTAARMAILYTEFNAARIPLGINQVYKINEQMETYCANCEYTIMTNIQAAKIAWEHNDAPRAIRYLEFVIDHAKDPGLSADAQLRLANIYIDQKQFDVALKLLMSKHDAAFDALFYAKRGDLYVVRGNLERAREAYKEALQKANNVDQATQQMIQFKLDAIGGGA